MRARSLGVTTLAFMSVMVALYAQLGAVALMLGGSVFTAMGSMLGAAALLLGAVFLGLAGAGYVVGYGLWTHKHWSWAGSVVVFATLATANVLLAVLATSPMVALLPIVGAAAGIWLLSRPAVKAELLGAEVPATATLPATDGMGVVEAAH